MDNGVNLFDQEKNRYVIPLYQRSFTWGIESYNNRENEIVQLMDDIKDAESDYYLGSLVVFHRPGQDVFEVIDGQQRLTALYLLFNCLGIIINKEKALSYDCRPKADYALNKLDDLKNDASLLEKEYDDGIYLGIRTINRKIELEKQSDKDYQKRLKQALEHVHLFRIIVPQCTDLNRYFEIMNTRGEQLEQHDVVKASLMSSLNTTEESKVFAEVWNACSDMTGYVQMHFSPSRREMLFGTDWSNYPATDKLIANDLSQQMSSGVSIQEIINSSDSTIPSEEANNDRVRFESIIDFQHFLLHVLKIFIIKNEIVAKQPGENIIDEMIDDKKLISSFERVQKNGIYANGEPIKKDVFAWRFMLCMLCCRFLFDKHIIKREYSFNPLLDNTNNDSFNGKWTLKELHNSNRRPYYTQTFNSQSEDETTLRTDNQNIYNKMIQSCLRVSYTSPKNMHWITELLKWIYLSPLDVIEESLFPFTQKIAMDAIYSFVFGNNYQLGVFTPHIVFNFLDFLLWKEAYEKHEEIDFEFEFRNSVEHWYPQNPSEREGIPPWNDNDGYGSVDRFGNLALLPSSINSRFSNQSPRAKLGYASLIANGSLKLRDMAKITENNMIDWKTQGCENHENRMLFFLRKAFEDNKETSIKY